MDKAIRVAYLVLLLRNRPPGSPKRLDTRALAIQLGTTQRNIQRDLHDVETVNELLDKLGTHKTITTGQIWVESSRVDIK